jgi:hypothetical protein
MGGKKLQGGATTEGGEKLQGGFPSGQTSGFPSGQTSGFPSVGKWRWFPSGQTSGFPDLKHAASRSQNKYYVTKRGIKESKFKDEINSDS